MRFFVQSRERRKNFLRRDGWRLQISANFGRLGEKSQFFKAFLPSTQYPLGEKKTQSDGCNAAEITDRDIGQRMRVFARFEKLQGFPGERGKGCKTSKKSGKKEII